MSCSTALQVVTTGVGRGLYPTPYPVRCRPCAQSRRPGSNIVHGKFAPRCNDIQIPTLRLMHKWLAITLFPRDDVRTMRNDELMILYDMVNKIKISPVKAMIKQWLTN
jgi:hypothetical protein